MEASEKAPVTGTATTRTFKGRVNGIKLIRQLGTKDKHFTEAVGKKRAIELIEALSKAADESMKNGAFRNVELQDKKKDIHMTYYEERTMIAKDYIDSEEAQKLCSVSLMNKQDAIFESVKNHVNNTKIYGKRRKDIVLKGKLRRKKAQKANLPQAAPIAKVVYDRKSYLETVEADLPLAMKVIKESLDQTGVQRIDMPDATYLRLNAGSESNPVYKVFKIANDLYIDAYVAAIKLSPKVKRQSTKG